jgi:hypothetical protein
VHIVGRYNKDEDINELLFAMLDCDGDSFVDLAEFRFICEYAGAKPLINNTMAWAGPCLHSCLTLVV